MGSAGVIHEARLHPAQPLELADDDVAVFVLNVGDADSIVVRLPVLNGVHAFGVVDCGDAAKTMGLINALNGDTVDPLIRFVVATHPHSDHIRGLRQVVRSFPDVGEFWDSGFRFTSLTYRRLIEEVEDQAGWNGLRFLRPTSGFEFFYGLVRFTVLSPSIYLRNRYDTYGVDVNNASIVIRVSYPVQPPSTDYPEKAPASGNASATLPSRPRTAILGGDAQTDAWGHVLAEFPHLLRDDQNWARQIGARTGEQPLACDFFKVSHHASKRGVNLELLERFGDNTGKGPTRGPGILAVSCSTDRPGGFGFPHLVTQELMREVRHPTAQSGDTHDPDDELGIHYTSQVIDGAGGEPAGSIAFVMSADRSLQLYRLCDAEAAPVDLSRARPVK